MNRSNAVLALIMMAGCSQAPKPAAQSTEPVRHYSMEGEVLRLEGDQIAVIRHKDIEGWMKAMTMEYPIRDQKEFAGLKAGEQIKATVNVQGGDYWVSNIRQYQSEAPAAANSAATPKNVPKGN